MMIEQDDYRELAERIGHLEGQINQKIKSEDIFHKVVMSAFGIASVIIGFVAVQLISVSGNQQVGFMLFEQYSSRLTAMNADNTARDAALSNEVRELRNELFRVGPPAYSGNQQK